MPIIVVCQNCRQRFQVSDKFAGRQGPCPKCKAIISIPKPEEQVKIHTPEHSEASARGASGKLVLKPIPRQTTVLTYWQMAVLGGSAALLLVGAFAMRKLTPQYRSHAALAGLVTLSAPLTAVAYTFLRDAELEPYSGLWFWVRAAICGAVDVGCWGGYLWLRDVGATDEPWKWVFLGPIFGVVGAGAAVVTLDLDWGNGFFHFCFYVGATALLAAVMGLAVF